MTFRTDRRVASRTLAAPLMTRETVPTPKPEAAATSAIVARRAADIVTLPNGAGGTGSISDRDHRRSAPPRRQGFVTSALTRGHALGPRPGKMPANRAINARLVHDLGNRDLQDVPRAGRLQRRDQRVDPALG